MLERGVGIVHVVRLRVLLIFSILGSTASTNPSPRVRVSVCIMNYLPAPFVTILSQASGLTGAAKVHAGLIAVAALAYAAWGPCADPEGCTRKKSIVLLTVAVIGVF